MVHYEVLVDPTCFRTVRDHLASSRSPITEVLFVATDDLLPKVATLLDAESELSPAFRRRQWQSLLRSGQVMPNLTAQGYGVDLDALPDDALCWVIFFPPIYLVHAPGLDLRASSQLKSACAR